MKLFTVFLFIFFSIISYAQPDYFWKIAYADMYTLQLHPNYNSGGYCTVIFNYENDDYFYPLLTQAGFTHIGTFAAPPSLEPNTPPFTHNNTLKIIDYDLKQLIQAYKSAGSNGNKIDFTSGFSYQVGGNQSPDLLLKGDNFGFGDNGELDASPTSAIWIWLHENDTEVGDKNADDQIFGVKTYKATKTGSSQPGILLKAVLPIDHQPQYRVPDDNNWRFSIKTRIEGNVTSNDLVATVYINEIPVPEEETDIYNYYNFYTEPETEQYPLLSTTWEIRANDFTDNSYHILYSDIFHKGTNPNHSELEIIIDWENSRTMYIDQLAVVTEEFKKLIIENNQVIIDSIEDEFQSYNAIASHPLFEHFYFDEPEPLMYHSLKLINDIAVNILGSSKYINGATLGTHLQKMKVANEIRRPPYILYNYYPIDEEYEYTSHTGTWSIQKAYDNWIQSDLQVNGTGSEVERGLKDAISWAKNFTPDLLSDDVLLINTVQVMGSKRLKNGTPIATKYKRPPTPTEIKCMGYLSLCYGAKGLMYYTINTNTPCDLNDNEIWANYGLFEEANNHIDIYDWANPSAPHWVQNPSNPQVTNDRFNAVQELNNEISLIENELLTLTWKEAYSIHKVQPPIEINYIKGLSSSDLSGTPDPPDESFVELGFFKKTAEYNNNLMDYFMLVNRRGLDTEGRTYEVSYDKSGTQYVNWCVWDEATGENWPGLAVDDFAVYIDPGKGKLFNLEPTVIGGGNLIYNETINSDIDLNGDLIIESGVTLTVNANYHCYGNITLDGGNIFGGGKIFFHDNKRIIVEGTSQIIGSAGTIELDFIAPHTMNGIRVMQDANFRAHNCIVRNARNGITVQSNTDYFRASLVQIL